MTDVSPPADFIAVAAGFLHTCGIRTNGTLDCWGWTRDGLLDPPGGRFIAVSAGDSYSCGIRTDRTIT